jgi:chaperone required for assembly of F1-ATPase
MVGMSKAKMENRNLPKRFYQRADFEPVDGDYRITLDGKELKTQARSKMRIVSRALAEAVANEWKDVDTHINPDRMPLTRLVNITLDRTPGDRASLGSLLVGYAETDLLCYRTPGLTARQGALFDPVLAWANTQGIKLNITDSLVAVHQPDDSLHAVRAMALAASDGELTALAMMAPLLGSAVLPLAVWKQQITVDEAMTMSRIDEDAQAEKWGRDAEAEAAWEHKKKDIAAAAFFLTANQLNKNH